VNIDHVGVQGRRDLAVIRQLVSRPVPPQLPGGPVAEFSRPGLTAKSHRLAQEVADGGAVVQCARLDLAEQSVRRLVTPGQGYGWPPTDEEGGPCLADLGGRARATHAPDATREYGK
jgi:hypothetical protein